MPTRRQAGEVDTGVLATIEVSGDAVKLVLLDARRKAAAWEPIRLYTDRTFTLRAFSGPHLDRKAYEDIGFAIIARLCALSGLEPLPQPPVARKRKRKQG